MDKIKFPTDFGKNNYEHLATIKAERSGGTSNGDLFYSNNRNEYDIKNVPLSKGFYTNGLLFYRVVGEYSEFSIYVFEKI